MYVDGHFKPYWGAVEIPKGFSRTYGVMKGIYEFFWHDVNGNAICSMNLPGDSDLLDGTDFVKKKDGSLDTLHGYDFYEVENRQHNNWLEKRESRLRGCLRSINARRKEIANLKGKIERIKKKASAAYEKMIGKLLRKNKQLEVAKEKEAAAVRAQTREKHGAAEKKRAGEIAEIKQTIEREQREAGEKIAVYRKAIEEKGKVIKKLECEMEEIENEISGQPKTMFEMNTALLDFIILLLILRDNMHSYT